MTMRRAPRDRLRRAKRDWLGYHIDRRVTPQVNHKELRPTRHVDSHQHGVVEDPNIAPLVEGCGRHGEFAGSPHHHPPPHLRLPPRHHTHISPPQSHIIDLNQ